MIPTTSIFAKRQRHYWTYFATDLDAFNWALNHANTTAFENPPRLLEKTATSDSATEPEEKINLNLVNLSNQHWATPIEEEGFHRICYESFYQNFTPILVTLFGKKVEKVHPSVKTFVGHLAKRPVSARQYRYFISRRYVRSLAVEIRAELDYIRKRLFDSTAVLNAYRTSFIRRANECRYPLAPGMQSETSEKGICRRLSQNRLSSDLLYAKCFRQDIVPQFFFKHATTRATYACSPENLNLAQLTERSVTTQLLRTGVSSPLRSQVSTRILFYLRKGILHKLTEFYRSALLRKETFRPSVYIMLQCLATMGSRFSFLRQTWPTLPRRRRIKRKKTSRLAVARRRRETLTDMRFLLRKMYADSLFGSTRAKAKITAILEAEEFDRLTGSEHIWRQSTLEEFELQDMTTPELAYWDEWRDYLEWAVSEGPALSDHFCTKYNRAPQPNPRNPTPQALQSTTRNFSKTILPRSLFQNYPHNHLRRPVHYLSRLDVPYFHL